ncbi:MAG: thioredoxin family protein [Bacteroidota bacterium]
MSKLWIYVFVGVLTIGCHQSVKRKHPEQASPVDLEKGIAAENGVIKTYKAALEQYSYYDDQVRRIAYKQEKDVINAYLDSALSAITGSTIGDYNFIDIEGRHYTTSKLSKPLFLMTSASWCKPCLAKVPALNKAVDEYKDSIDFIILFQDDDSYVMKIKEDYHEDIFLVPHRSKLEGGRVDLDIGGFKHLTSYPTAYLISPEKVILKLSQGAFIAGKFNYDKEMVVTKKQAFLRNLNSIKNDIGLLLGKPMMVEVEDESPLHQSDYSSIKL